MEVTTHNNELSAFVVNGNIYRVISTTHALKNLRDRKLDAYHISGACLSLGMKLEEYNNSGNHIMLIDKGKNLSVVLTVENCTVVIITVINKSNVFVKENTLVEDFNFQQIS